uniref:Reverse transcriptase Ty1/copia-type domain-containing protein n=1 Tax=Tanacetum cinerariifolium TaxID=118510 RepID=A0A6L2NN76_TANCI|nr:hypothetical protein [Tanacetum cinerariifolium]
MDDQNITIEEYIRLEEEKAQKHGKVFNWEIAKYGKIWYDEDVHDLRFVETEFLAIVFNDNLTSNEHYLVNLPIVYNDALMSKSDFPTEPTLCPQHIDEFDLKDETSLFEYDEVEQNILYFNDLFPFNIIHLGDLKSATDNDDNEIDMIQPSGKPRYVFFTLLNLGKLVFKNGYGVLDTALPPRDQRHQYLRFKGLQYSEGDIANFDTRLAKIYKREVHTVQVFNFRGLPDLMANWLSSRMLMEHMDAQRLIACSFIERSQAPKKVTVTDLFYLRGMDIGLVNVPYQLARYLRLFTSGRKQGTMISDGQFVARLEKHFELLTEERLQGVTMIVQDLPIIDMAGLVRLQLCVELVDTWAWATSGPERQPDAVVGTPKAAEDAPIVDEGASAVPAPVQAPQPPPPASGPAQTMSKRLARVVEDVHEIQETVVGLSQMMSQAKVRIKRLHDDIRVTTAQEDANMKLLRSLPSAWNNIALIIRNKSDLDILSIDDLYNNQKVYESNIKGQSSSSSNSHNLAFVFLDNIGTTNETVNSAHSDSAASSKDQALLHHLEQIDTDDLEEMDLKWQVVMLTMRVKRECMALRNQRNKNKDSPTRNAPVDTSTTNALVVQDGIGGYDWSFQAEEELTNFSLMAYTSQGSSSSSSSDFEVHTCFEECLQSYEALQKQYDQQRETLNKSNLKIIDKIGLGYDGQMNESDLNDIHVNESEVLNNVFDSRKSDGDNGQVNDRFKKGEGYHAVPPPYTGNCMPPRADLSFAGLDDLVFKSKVSKTITSVPKLESSASKTSKDSLEKPKTFRPSAPLIEEWESNSKDKNVLESKEVKKTAKPSLEKIKFLNARNTTVENENKAEKPRKFSQSPTDCNFYENKMVLNNKGKITGPKENRQVWDNTARVNHQNKLTHPHPKRNFVLAAVLIKFGQVPINAAKQSSHRAATSVSAARRVNTATSRPNGNPQDALQDQEIFNNGCSRHMIGNKSYLTDYQEIDGKIAAFEGNAKGGNQTNGNAGTKANINAGQVGKKTVPGPQYVLLPLLTTDSQGLKSSEDEVVDDAGKKNKDANGNRMFTPISAVGSSYVELGGSIPVNAAILFNADLPTDHLIPDLEDTADLQYTRIFSGAYEDEVEGKHAIGTKWVYRNKKDKRGIVVRNKERMVTQDYTQEEGTDYDEVFAPVARIEAIRLFLACASFIGFLVYQIDVKSAFLYGSIEEEVYVCQPPGFEDPHFPDKVYKVEKALYGLHQAPRAWYETLSTYLLENRFRRGIIDKTLFIKKDKGLQVMQRDGGIFISQDKYVAGILKKFDFSSVKTASIPIKTNKALLKDEESKDVDVHLYRSMIGSLMYLTASRTALMFAVCACSRFQVTPKVSHLHAVNRIFRYLKGQPKLGLWYPRDSSFELEAFSNSDYVGAKYVVAANYCGQFWATAKVKNVNGEAQIQSLVDKKKVIITEASIRRDLRFEDKGGVDYLSSEVVFEQWTLMGSTMASAIICLATNQNFNFLKYIFDNMVKHLDGGVKFLMYPRFVQVFLDNKVKAPKYMGEDLEIPTDPYHTSIVTQPSSSLPQKKQKSRRKQRKKIEVPTPSSEIPNEESVPTPSNDPLPSGEDKIQLNELMILCTNLQKQVLDLEEAKTAQAKEIASLKKIGRINEEDMFGVNDLDGDKVVVDVLASVDVEQSVKVVKKEVSTANPITITGEVVTTAGIEVTTAATSLQISKNELTLVQTLIDIKAAKPKAITTVATIVTIVGTRPKEKGIVMLEPSETPLPKPIDSSQKPSQAKYKGKGKVMQAELEEEERLKRLKEEETNIALFAEWDNTQAMMDVYCELDVRLQEEETEELSIEEKSREDLEVLWSIIKVDYEVKMAYDLLRLIRRQINEGYVPE